MAPAVMHPGVYVQEIPSGVRTIAGVATSITAFIGRTARGPIGAAHGVDASAGVEPRSDAPVTLWSFGDFQREFGELDAAYPMSHAVHDFFANGGSQAVIVRVARPDGGLLEDADYIGSADDLTGLQALRKVDLFNLLCVPPDTHDGDTSPAVLHAALALCVERRAMLIVDAPAQWDVPDTVTRNDNAALTALGIDGAAARNAALYFPRLRKRDPAMGRVLSFAACGAVAGVMARTDSNRGVWKAPAGSDASIQGVADLALHLSDEESGRLNPVAVNCLRKFPIYGHVVWGARTMAGGDARSDEYKYVSVRRLALYIEESVSRGVRWAAAGPNDETLWAQLRLNIGAFLHVLFRQGAFQGNTPRDAYFVQCDAETTTASDLKQGICNIIIGFAPLKPGEFVVIRIAQTAAPAGPA